MEIGNFADFQRFFNVSICFNLFFRHDFDLCSRQLFALSPRLTPLLFYDLLEIKTTLSETETELPEI